MPSGYCRKGVVHVAVVGLVAAAIMPILPPEMMPPCPIRRLFGIACPGCGMTRSFEAVAHGDIVKALGYHPLGPPLVVGALMVVMMEFLPLPGLREQVDVFLQHPTVCRTIGFILILFAIVRMAVGMEPPS